MSNDLISRSTLIDGLKQCGMIADNDYGNAIVDFINNQPTAYDVDKVVEQLENPKNYTIVCGKHFTTTGRAIEVVKAGVVNENQKEN